MDLPLRCVIDASVCIKLFVEEELSAEADRLFSHLAADPQTRFYVPTLFYAECGNIFWKYVRQGECTKAAAAASLSRLMALALERIDVALLVPEALPLAVAHNITVYDACYVALARHCQAPLVTADDRLAKKVQPRSAQMLVLGTVEIPPCPEKE